MDKEDRGVGRQRDPKGRRVLSLDHGLASGKLIERGTRSAEAEYFAQERDTRRDDTVQELMGALSETHREVLYMRFYDRMTLTEIAVRRGCSKQAVHRMIHRALKEMTHAIASKGRDTYKAQGEM
jgi:RNA polymerase sigma factor (sigma-70 family)